MTIGRKPVSPPLAGFNQLIQLSSSSTKENMMMSEPVLSDLMDLWRIGILPVILNTIVNDLYEYIDLDINSTYNVCICLL